MVYLEIKGQTEENHKKSFPGSTIFWETFRYDPTVSGASRDRYFVGGTAIVQKQAAINHRNQQPV
jgi:hypothetical protein